MELKQLQEQILEVIASDFSRSLVTYQRLASEINLRNKSTDVTEAAVLEACLDLVESGKLVESRSFRLRDCND